MLGLERDPPVDRESQLRPERSSTSIASVYDMRAKVDVTSASSRFTASGSIRSTKNAMSSGRSSSTARKAYFSRSSARSALSWMSAKATSGSTIQNSERWRLCSSFGAEGGPEV